MTKHLMVGVYPDGKITNAIFNDNGEIIEETPVLELTENEKTALNLTKPLYYDFMPKHLKIEKTANGMTRFIPAEPLPKGFGLQTEEDFYKIMFIQRIILNRYANKNNPSFEDEKQ